MMQEKYKEIPETSEEEDNVVIITSDFRGSEIEWVNDYSPENE